MKHSDDTGEFGNSVVGDSGGYGVSGSGESGNAGDTGLPVNLNSRFIIA